VDLPVPEHMRPLRERMLAFLTERVYPVEKTLERGKLDPEGGSTLRRLQDEAKEAGLWALGHPTSMGGGGLPYLDYLYVNEIVGMSEYAIYVFGTHTLHDCMMLDRYASAEWRDKYLQPMADGDIPGPSFGMTERDVASSDPTQLQTTAVLDGDEWVINGLKWFTTHAHSARYTVVMARTEPDAPPHKAFSMIIVPTDTPGYDIVRTIPVMGETDGDHCEVRYSDVRVPATNLLGERGTAFGIAQQRLLPGRIFHVMRFLGQAQRAFDLLCQRAVSRVAFGSVLADKQLIQKMIFDSATEIQSTRLLVLEAARRLDAGEQPRIEVGIAKVMGAAMLHNVIDRAIQVHGSIGLTADLPLERMYRQARFARLYDGPDETHVQNVAKMLLRPYRSAQ